MKDKRIEEKIRKQAENIPVPDSLQPEQIEKKLEGVEQKKFLSFHTTNAMRKWIAGVAAACLVLIAGSTWGILQQMEKIDTKKVLQKELETSEVSQAEPTDGQNEGVSYTDLYASIDEYLSTLEVEAGDENIGVIEYGETDDALKTESSSLSSSSSSKTDFSETDTQVDDIMEGDIVKTDGSHIFTAGTNVNGSQVRIYEVNGKEATCLSKINISKQDILEMYLSGKYLVLLTENWDVQQKDKTKIIVYDFSDDSKPEKIAEHSQSGIFSTSRFVDGILYTFSDYQVSKNTYKKNKPKTYVPSIDGTVMKEDELERITDEDSNRYMVMTSLKIEQPQSFVDTFSAFGGSDVYYMNNNHIYVTETIYSDKSEDSVCTQITMFSYESGAFSKKASTQVRGTIKDSYYMHEYNGYFCFVYTRYRDGIPVNGLCVMDENLELTGELDNLGKNETIYSSYYIDNMAYFVTYRQTDPVFAVDLSNPKKPKLKSKLKLPGFSEYLHSFGENQLVGVGYGEWESDYDCVYQTVKFSLFEQDSDNQLSERTSVLIGRHLSSIAGSNHKAVFIDEERKLLGLAVSGWNGNASYRLFQYKNGKWKCILKQKNISSVNQVRGIRIGDYFYVADTEQGICGYDIRTK